MGYAWVRNQLTSEADPTNHKSITQSSTSSSDSESDSDVSISDHSDHSSIGSSAARKTAKTKRNWLLSQRRHSDEIRTPDQLDQNGWQYRLSITVGETESVWISDDPTLRLEALKDVDRISKVIRRVRAAKEID